MADPMFKFEDIHVKALLKILNFLNQEFLDTRTVTKPALPRGKGRPPTKSAPKTVVPQMTIESIDLNNRQLIIDSILNCCQYFDQYFKYNYKFVVIKTDSKITRIQKWLHNYYKRNILSKVDFDVVVKEVPLPMTIDATSADQLQDPTKQEEPDLVSFAEGSAPSLNLENAGPQPAQDMELDTIVTDQSKDISAADLCETQMSAKEDPMIEELNSQITYQLELILLLMSIIFYKVRNLFPKLLDYLEFAWIYLQEFESRLESEVEIEHLIDLLQNEFISQRNANKMRSEVLSNEIIQLNAMIDNLEKQYEDETRELIYLQNASIIGVSSGVHTRQLSKIMSLKTGPPREQKIWSCHECGKTFKNGYKLNRHQYVHRPDAEKPFSCDWPGCGYRSIATNDLNRHKMIHTGEKPFTCGVDGCDRKYSRPDKLSHHKKMVHCADPLDKKFACDWPGCGYRSVSNSDMVRHQYIHTGERPFKCEFSGCDKAFSRPDKLRNHKDKARHNMEELLPALTLSGEAEAMLSRQLPLPLASAISIADCVPQAIQLDLNL